MAAEAKTAAVAALKDAFATSSGAVLTEYRGLTVAQLSELRRALGQHARFIVVKNTLTRIAAQQAGVGGDLGALLQGPSAVAFVRGDVVEAAKGLRDFAKAHPALIIKGGMLDGKPLTTDDVARLASLESRDVLLAKVAGALKASTGAAAATLNALPLKTVRLADALRATRAA